MRKRNHPLGSIGTGRQPLADVRLCVGVGGKLVVVARQDLPSVLGGDEACRAFDRLCERGCDPLVLLYILKAIRYRLPSYWWDGDESERQAERRRDDAATLDRAADVLEVWFGEFLPVGQVTDEQANNLKAWDEWSLAHGGVAPLRMLLGLRSAADHLRARDDLRVASGLRANQNDYDMISRYVVCAYVERMTGSWHDRLVVPLLLEVGNHKPNRRKAVFDEVALRQWRGTNQPRLAGSWSWSVDQLVALSQKNVESHPAK